MICCHDYAQWRRCLNHVSSSSCADVAESCFNMASAGCKVRVVRGNAIETMKAMKAEGQKFDIVFLDADKDDYIDYYKLIMDSGGLLNPNGFILADLTMCALLYDATDGRYT